MGDLTKTYVSKKPKCNFCDKTAEYDARTGYNGSPWAYMCEEHFKEFGIGLGLGLGQRLLLKSERGFDEAYTTLETRVDTLLDEFLKRDSANMFDYSQALERLVRHIESTLEAHRDGIDILEH